MFLPFASKGIASLASLLFIIGAGIIIAGSMTTILLTDKEGAQRSIYSLQSYYAAEGGIEDASYRLENGIPYSPSYTINVGSSQATVTVASNNSLKTVESDGQTQNNVKKIQATLNVTTVTSHFFFGAQVDAGGIIMGNGAKVIGNVFSNGSINGGRVTGNATVATGLTSTPTVEWPVGCTSSCGDSNNAFATVSSNQDIAQSFIATATGPLNKISVFLGKTGAPINDIALRVTADSSNHPNTSNLPNGSAIILRSSVGASPSWIDVTFSTPPNVINGTKYWIVLDYSANSAVNYWNWRKDSTDGYVNNTGKSTANWSSGGAVWVNVGGDLAFRLWISGINNQITNTTIDGVGRAPAFVNVTAGGVACPNANCIVTSDAPQSLPISDGVIQDWRYEAAAGGIINGDYAVSGSQNLGPTKINGNLTMNNNSILTVTGTIWITGGINTGNNATIKLSSGYGTNSGVIVADGIVDLSNNTIISGSGQAGSYLMVIGAKNDPAGQVMDISNNTTAGIYYANHGRIHFNNNAGAKEVTGYGFDFDNNASVTYESGLANVHFTSGPGGSFNILSWKEI